MNNTTDDNFDNTNNFEEFDDFDMQNVGQDFEEFQEDHKPKTKTKALATIVFLCALGGIGFAGYQYYFKPMLNAQNHADLDDGSPAYGAADTGLPPTVTSDAAMPQSDPNPVADTLTPPAPPSVDAAASTPPVPPSIADDGTVPPDMLAQLPQEFAEQEGSVSNQALPAPVGAAIEPAVEAPARVATPAEASAVTAIDSAETATATPAEDNNTLITPTLPQSTTGQVTADSTAADAMPTPAITTNKTDATETESASLSAESLPAPVETTQPAVTTHAVNPQTTTQLQALEQKVAQLPSADSIAALTRQIEALTQRLDALDKRTETLATNLQNREAAPVPVAPVASPAATADNSAPVAKPAPKKAAVKAKPKQAPRPSAQSGWILRSAQPGAAWLSKPGSEEMVRYAVGQTLPGAGTITAVTQENGGWVLKTDRGVIIRP